MKPVEVRELEVGRALLILNCADEEERDENEKESLGERDRCGAEGLSS